MRRVRTIANVPCSAAESIRTTLFEAGPYKPATQKQDSAGNHLRAARANANNAAVPRPISTNEDGSGTAKLPPLLNVLAIAGPVVKMFPLIPVRNSARLPLVGRAAEGRQVDDSIGAGAPVLKRIPRRIKEVVRN